MTRRLTPPMNSFRGMIDACDTAPAPDPDRVMYPHKHVLLNGVKDLRAQIERLEKRITNRPTDLEQRVIGHYFRDATYAARRAVKALNEGD